MYKPKYTKSFNKDIQRLERSGSHDIEKLKVVIQKLINGEPLEPRYKDHKLIGNYEGHRDCHVEPDWILIYRIDREAQTITFTRTGSHADLFE
jgi:mRNA interferase YafQ